MTDDGGPAYPTGIASVDGNDRPLSPRDVEGHGLSGMSLRDYFAAAALSGILARTHGPEEEPADLAYIYADTMLKRRQR